MEDSRVRVEEHVHEGVEHPPHLLGRCAPGWLELPEIVPGDLDQSATISIHLIEVGILVHPRRGAVRKDDLRPVRRPGRPAVALFARQLDQMRAVGQDGVELRRGASGEGGEGLEKNPCAIGRPMRIPGLQVPPRCHLFQTRAITVDDEQCLILI